MTTVSNKKSRLKPWLWAAGILFIAGLAVVYYLFTLKFDDTSDVKADFTVNALSLIDEFAKDNKAANLKYSEKIVTVNGRVSEIEAADTTVNLKFTDTTTGNYAIFAFQQNDATAVKAIKAGDSVTVKGSCSGGNFSEILETTYITFKRSALIK